MHRGLHGFSIGAVALLIGLLAFAAAPISHGALAQGERISVTKQVEPFTSIELSGGGQAVLTFGTTPSVTIEGNSLIVERLNVKVENGTLELGSLLTSVVDVPGLSSLIYTIVTPSIEEIHLSGTIDLRVDPMPNQSSLVLGLTIGSEVFIPAIDAGTISGKLDLLSTAHLGGSADTLQLEINNGSTLDASNLQVGAAELVLNGVSTATVRVTESLTGRAAQGSTVSYISQTVQPDITLTTLARVEQLPFTEWVPSGSQAFGSKRNSIR